MQAFFQFLAANPYILLFFDGRARGLDRPAEHRRLRAWHGRRRDHRRLRPVGLGFDSTASKLELNNFTRPLFYYLFMYGVGLRVGPSFVNSLGATGSSSRSSPW